MQNSKRLVSVVIVTCDQVSSLQECIQAVACQSYPERELIVVNNGQKKITESLLSVELPMKVLNNRRNLFYAQALNEGIRNAQGEYILFLNDDVVLSEHFIEYVLKGFTKGPRVGMVSGKVLSFYNHTMLDSTGLLLGKNRTPVDRGFKERDNAQYDQEGYVFGVPGACGIYKREMLEDITINGDYLDPDYYIFYEDLDLCWRAHNRGWQGYFIPQAIACHKRGKTVQAHCPRIKFLSKYNFARLSTDLQSKLLLNRYKTIIKNDTLGDFVKNIFYILAYEIKCWSYILLFRPALIYHLLSSFTAIGTSFQKRVSLKKESV